MAELLHKLLHCYDSRVRVQTSQGSKPTEVTVSLFILSIGNFEVRDMVGNYTFYNNCRILARSLANFYCQ